ncbi:YhdT family protein, partial [Xenorhabdus bovienii]|uniref:YhdT family protein n=2 Tax=Morganellaceae TaxID=1903414 RepID=UPI0023B3260E
AYLVGWLLSAYLPSDAIGITGLPHWFELACLLLPALFIILCWLMIKFIFKDIPLEDSDAK